MCNPPEATLTPLAACAQPPGASLLLHLLDPLHRASRVDEVHALLPLCMQPLLPGAGSQAVSPA